MSSLEFNMEQFDNDFAELTGHQPFLWQKRLFKEWFACGRLPSACDIPTGLGKTSVMAAWLIALANGASLPRRLVYVVDRRAVVDQATRFAEQLRKNMPLCLASKLQLGDDGLPISTLRGGFADNRGWLEDPSKPAIIVGTIDMVGSRLLFEGYGVSRRMRPYHAGFLGVDTLVVLDESHLCPPFEALLIRIATDRDGKFWPASDTVMTSIIPPARLVSLSATGRATSRTETATVFRLKNEDWQEPTVHERLTAHKWLKFFECDDARKLPQRLAERAVELGKNTPSTRILVYCDSRRDAVAAKTLIDKEIRPKRKAKGEDSKVSGESVSELLIGERRVYERQKLERWLEQNGFLGDANSVPQAPAFLIATSAGEVGVDLDADHMVCDLVAFERMVQRFGRVNRRGGAGREALIDAFLVPEEPPKAPKEDAKESVKTKYKRALREFKAREARKVVLQKLSYRSDDQRYNASPGAIVKLKSDYGDIVDTATTPAPLYPELTRPLLDAWSMTSLKQHEGRPEVTPWLRGWEKEEEPQTSVAWRKYLPLRRDGDEVTAPASMVTQFFQNTPIHTSEKLEAQRNHVFDWILKRIKQIHERSQNHEFEIQGKEIVALVIDRAGEYIASHTMDQLLIFSRPDRDLNRDERRRRSDWQRVLAGATLIVDARIGGLQDGMLKEQSEEMASTADADETWRNLKEDPAAGNRPVIKSRVEPLTVAGDADGFQTPELDDWRLVYTFEADFDADGSARGGLAVYKWPDSAEDEDSRSILSAPQSLRDHADEVSACVRKMAKRLRLPDEEADALFTAARLHDDGKAAVRWQNAMNAPQDGRPYAKTRGGNGRLLGGYRHEFGSLLRAEQEDLPEDTHDLILHLITSHHGYARPLINSVGCEDGPPSLLEAKAGEVALRFARLQKLYGPWGLAWLEAVLRAADGSASRNWDKRSRQAQTGSGGNRKDG